MENLEHFTLARFKQLLEQQDAQTVQHYISQNFAVARHANAAKFQIAFGHEPVVMDDMRILIVVQGQARPVINLIERHFQAPELVYLGPNGLVQFHEVSPDAQGIGLSISNEFLSLVLGTDIPKAFDGHLRDFHFRLQPDELQLLDRLHLLICESVRLATPNLPGTMRLIAAFLWLVDGLWSSREDEERTALSREQRLFADFMQLVAQHAAHEHHISYYASQL
ncbi:MAG: hypothetical protein IJ160_05115, partial [Muribaculaceae bacterium]|nr:hypothetical protein [Muribaculaceae bacterium]